MSDKLRLCTDMILPRERHAEAAGRAIEEREGNAVRSDLRSIASLAPQDLVSLTGKRWRSGRTILVHFLDGPDWARERAFEMVSRWRDVTNLTYERTREKAASDIRITFERGGSWSYLGTDNLAIPTDQPTMQLGWLLDDPDNIDEWRRVCVHEGGHAISFGHEHQHPRPGFEWREEAVYAYYARTQGWSRAQTYQQVIRTYSELQTNFSAYDRDSIMEYPIPRELVMDPADAVGWNDTRSPADKRYAALWYPVPALNETIGRYVDFLERAATNG